VREASSARVLAAGCAVLAIGCAVVLVAGCGHSRTPRPGSSQTATTSPHSIAAPGPTPAPASLLATVVIRRADLPGWAGTPFQDDPSAEQDQANLLRCTGGRDTDSDKVAEAHSQNFTLGQAGISSEAASYRNQSAVDSDVALLHNPKFPACYQALVKSGLSRNLPAGTTIRSAKVTVTPGPGSGPANVAGTATAVLAVNTAGGPVTVYADIAFITGPMLEAEVDTENVGSPVPAALRRTLIQAVAARAARG
jgi:hypothetical protein